jgi:predicted O-linked N-acetylglucosamine transferase (SPINDLY family)
MSDVEVAKLSRDLNIDIAVDLKGFTQDALEREYFLIERHPFR